MRSGSEKKFNIFVIILVAAVSLSLIVAAVSMLIQYSNQVAEQSASAASYNTLNAKAEVELTMNEYVAKAQIVAHELSQIDNETDLTDYLNDIRMLSGFSDVDMARYFVGDKLYSVNGLEYEGIDSSREYRAQTPDRAGYIGIFDDTSMVEGTMSVVGFYAPVENSDLIDAVVIYYLRPKVYEFFKSDCEDAEFSVFCTTSGEILVDNNGKELENSRIRDVLRAKIGEKEPVDSVMQLLQQGKDGTVSVKIGADDYIVSVGADKNVMRDLGIVELYRVDVLSASTFDFISTIIGIFIIFVIIAVIIVSYLVIHRVMMKRAFLKLETYNKVLQCRNRRGFEIEAGNILERNKTSYFAVIVFQLRHYKFLLDSYGEGEIENLLQYLRLITHKTIRIEETYGHVEEGQFLLLLHAKNQDDLVERLKLHASMATRYKGAHTFDVLLKYGIYELDKSEAISVNQMIDYANEANNSIVRATVQNATMRFNFYNNELRRIRLINEDMELRMEGALQNGEFQVFYQPKYNLNQNRQDGCEALVRWYDSKTNEYNRPALFMPLFESNGFIIKLDKYVFTKVCEYISYSLANGRTVFPVSVNISRITAVQPDFIDYYSKVKKKYGIANGQIMIEFTESFAYENYETLNVITDGLHKNGFKCSIDDFGCGYSSYRILKSLPMDEIKLDKFFLEKGLSEERDYHIIESIIDVAKKLGMKVTQEGVENYEDIERLRKLGCDVIQGYYYSHPLSLSDYISFVASTREHNIK